jgi:hypothetical protein
MQEAVKQRLDLAKEMFRRPMFRNILLVWAAISVWDTFVSEMLPENIAANAPRVYKVAFWTLAITSGWMSLWGWLMIGMALLVVGSIEFVFRWTSAETRRLQYLNPAENAEKDMLDFLVEGLQAIEDITKTLDSTTRDTVRFSKMLNRYRRVLPYITSFKLRRKILSRVASNINAYSRNLKRKAGLIGTAGPAVRDNQISYIERSVFSSPQDLLSLSSFAAVAGTTAQVVTSTIVKLEEMSEASVSIRGIIGDLNAASSGLVVVLDFFIGKVKDFSAMCEQIQTVAMKKLTDSKK